MKEKWVVSRKGADFAGLARELGVDPVMTLIMRNRGLTTVEEMNEYLKGGIERLHDPHMMKDMDKACGILSEKIQQNKHIRIVGDYDVDGVESTYILYSALKNCGAVVSWAIPDRVKHGYGLHMDHVEDAYRAGVDTIITCDNGISATEEISHAKELGLTVIVTDHHDIPYMEENGVKKEMLPVADAIVNPKQSECLYPFKKLCGAAVAYKVVCVLYEKLGMIGCDADEFLENAGMATVADVMDLEGENRIIVREGLKRLNNTSNIGMRALIDANELKYGVRASTIGFRLGPCINACGRLKNAGRALELLLCKDSYEAAIIAGEMVSLNETRKEMTEEALEKAVNIIEENGYDQDKVILVCLEDCHESLAGIVAGRIKEKYYRPALVMTKNEDSEGIAKGSARSIESYSMYDELNKCADLLLKYGGHPMAAGFSLNEENIDALRKRLNENAILTEDDMTKKIVIDSVMPIDYITEKLCNELPLLEPIGRANEKPVFADRNLKIVSFVVRGKEGRVNSLELENVNGFRIRATYFGDTDDIRNVLAAKYGDAVADDTVKGRCQYRPELNFLYYPKLDTYFVQPKVVLEIGGFN